VKRLHIIVKKIEYLKPQNKINWDGLIIKTFKNEKQFSAMMEYSYELKIPHERVPVLIGKNGEVKKGIESDTKTKISVDSKEGDIFVYGQDALGLYTAREVIRSIGRGFNPEKAKLLLKQDYVLEVVSLNEFAGKSKNTLLRLKGRVIGKEGKSRKLIEELSEAYVSVYGKTIGIIGLPESATMAKRAVEALLRGSTHSSVYKWLEKRRRELKKKKIIEMI
jgi:ribosomal RNA assembly protein